MEFNFDILTCNSDPDVRPLTNFICRTLDVTTKAVFLDRKRRKRYFDDVDAAVTEVSVVVKDTRLRSNELYSKFILEFCKSSQTAQYLLHISPTFFLENPLFQAQLKCRNTCRLFSISFGTFVNLKEFRSHLTAGMHEMNRFPCNSVGAIFEHDRRRCLLQLEATRQNGKRFEFEIPYDSLKSITICSPLQKTWHLYLSIDTPPLLYERENVFGLNSNQHLDHPTVAEPRDNVIPFDENDNERDDDSYREEEWVIRNEELAYAPNVRHLRRTSLDPSVPPELLVKCNVIRLEFLKPRKHTMAHWKLLWSICRNISRYSGKPIFIANVQFNTKSFDNERIRVPYDLPFNVKYAVECLECLNFRFHDEIQFNYQRDEFKQLIQEASRTDSIALENALYDVHRAISEDYHVNCMTLLRRRFEVHNFARKRVKIHMMSVRRCIFTPSRCWLLPPQFQLQSRFLRNSDPDYALRVTIRDDNLEMLQFTLSRKGAEDHQKEFLEEYILEPLLNGIRIFDRVYEFLGSSTSQLRDIGAVFYAPDTKGCTSHKIRSLIGDVSHINVIGKRISRLGQYFSQSMTYVDLPKEFVSTDVDIFGGLHEETGEPYVFSDGIGKISLELAEEITQNISKHRPTPYSAFQIRYAGAKGMLCLHPDLKGRQITLRKSMSKFPSSSSTLEILKIGEPRTVYLNRQIISILETLGVSRNVFLDLERDAFLNIFDSFVCGCKSLEVIKTYSLLRLDFTGLRESRIDILSEPLFQGILCLAAKHALTMIRTKAQIPLTHEKAKMAFGVLDEYRVLKEDEIFVQFSTKGNGTSRTVVTGTVLVLRHPCMHSGDIRKFTAVDKPELHHISDCVVFSQVGTRPQTDKLSGGDLDGDEYAVIWYEPVMFSGGNSPAMVYPRASPTDKQSNITPKDMLRFYIDFMNSEPVGILGNAHLAIADGSPFGVLDPNCLKLAKQYALALDFTKSGCPVGRALARPAVYPDFMEKHATKASYISRKVLGDIFWICSDVQENTHLNILVDKGERKNSELFTYPGYEEYIGQAKSDYMTYCYRISVIQKRFGIDSELALVSGLYSKTDKYICARQEKSDLKLVIDEMVKQVFTTTRHEFFKGIAEGDENLLMAKASAWYLVSKDENVSHDQSYYAFPWIVSDILCRIADRNSGKGSSEHNCLLRPREDINPQRFEEFLAYLKRRYPELEQEGLVSFSSTRKDPYDISRENLTTVCLSLRSRQFRFYIQARSKDFLDALRLRFGVKEINCEIYGQSGKIPGNLFVTFTGPKANVKLLKKHLMNKEFQLGLSSEFSL